MNYYSTYLIGRAALLTKLPALSELRPLPSSFRVNWRVLNIDDFHRSIIFHYPVKCITSIEAVS